jgi:hypothetical protein
LSVLLSAILSTVVRLTDKDFRIRAVALSYCAAALIAMLSANLLTVALSWALLDLLTLAYGLALAKESASLRSLLAHVIGNVSGIFLIIATAIINRTAGGIDDLGAPLATPWAFALLLLAVMMRLGFVRHEFSLARIPGMGEVIGTLMSILPSAAALVVVVRQVAHGIPEALEIWLNLASVVGLIISGARWLLESDSIDRHRFLIHGMTFLGFLAASAAGESFEVPLLSAVVVAIVVSCLSRVGRIYAPWHRAVPVLGALVMVMPAWSAGGGLVQGLASGFTSPGGIWIGIAGALGLAAMAGGMLHNARRKIETWYVDDMARLIYSGAMLVPILVGFGIGAGSGRLGVPAGLLALATMGIVAGGAAVSRRLDRAVWQQARHIAGDVDMGAAFRVAEGTMQWLSGALRSIGGMLEGEGAMLWIFVIVLMVGLMISGSLQ